MPAADASFGADVTADPVDPPCLLCGLRTCSDCTCSRIRLREQDRDQRLSRRELELRQAQPQEAG
jgi:hypothetical protein